MELKWLTGALLALLSLWALGSLGMNAGPFLLFGLAGTVFCLARPVAVSRIPESAWRYAGFAILGIIVVDFLLSLPTFLPPLVRMVLLLLTYRVLAPRRRREDLQLVLLCLFCVIISGVLTVSLLFAVQVLLFTPVAMGLLFLICLLDRGPSSRDARPQWRHFAWRQMVRRVWAVLDLRVIGLAGLMFAFVVAVSTILFILTPRFNLDQAIPFLEMQGEAKSGFTEEVRLGAVTSIGNDNSVALRIDVPSLESVASTPYWRMLVLDSYGGGNFRMSEALKTRDYRGYRKERTFDGWGVPPRERVGARWTFYMEGETSRYLPLPGAFAQLRFQSLTDVVLFEDLHLVGLDSVRQNLFSYQVEDLRFNARFPASAEAIEAFAAGPEPIRGNEAAYPMTLLQLNIDASDFEYLRRLNEAIFGPEGPPASAEAFSRGIVAYLQREHPYSRSPAANRTQRDAIVAWLEAGGGGHCEYFAGAFALLARAAGYPARVAVGFKGGSWNPVEAFYVVRNRDAHAWVELYDGQRESWLRVDPTPGAGSGVESAEATGAVSFETGWGAWIDSLRMQWYRRIVNFEQSDQIAMASGVKAAWETFKEGLSTRLEDLRETVEAVLTAPLEGKNPLWLGLGLAACLTGALAWYFRHAWLGWLRAFGPGSGGMAPVRREAGRLLRRYRRREQARSEADTPQLDASLRECRRDLEALRFGPGLAGAEARRRLKRARQCYRRRSRVG